MPLDHFDSSSSKTFKNRYWVNSSYYEPGGPVFREIYPRCHFKSHTDEVQVFDSGEQNAEPLLPYYLQVTYFACPFPAGPELISRKGISRSIRDNAAREAVQRSGHPVGTPLLRRFAPFPSQCELNQQVLRPILQFGAGKHHSRAVEVPEHRTSASGCCLLRGLVFEDCERNTPSNPSFGRALGLAGRVLSWHTRGAHAHKVS